MSSMQIAGAAGCAGPRNGTVSGLGEGPSLEGSACAKTAAPNVRPAFAGAEGVLRAAESAFMSVTLYSAEGQLLP
jgi:hypothetical protein